MHDTAVVAVAAVEASIGCAVFNGSPSYDMEPDSGSENNGNL